MADPEIDPPPDIGTWIELGLLGRDPANPNTPPDIGTWIELGLFTGWRQGGWHVGRVVF